MKTTNSFSSVGIFDWVKNTKTIQGKTTEVKNTLVKKKTYPKMEDIKTYPKKHEVNLSQAELFIWGKQNGLKNMSRMTKEEMCNELGIEPAEKPIKVVLTNMETNEMHGFSSLNNASVVMKVSKGSLSYFDGKEKGVNIGGVKYKVNRYL